MADNNHGNNGNTGGGSGSGGGGGGGRSEGRGTTTIADNVVAKIAGLSAREVSGVHALGGAASQAMGAVRKRVGSSGHATHGVSVEVGQKQATVDLTVVVDYDRAIHKVAEEIRQHVVSTVQRMTGLEVLEVNINVTDVYLEGSDDDDGDDGDGGGGSSGSSARRSLQ